MTIKAKNQKNTIGGLTKATTEFNIGYDGKIDVVAELADILVEDKIVESRGAWIYYGENKWNGRDALIAALREQPELLKELEGKVKDG